MPCVDRRGFTLAEVLVAAGVSLLMAGVFFKVFVPAMSHSAKGTTRLELRQFALLAFYQIQNELSHTRPNALSAADAMLATHPQVSLDGSGLPIWADSAVLFSHLASEEKLAKYSLPGATEKPNRYAPVDLLALRPTLGAPEKILASFVSEFRVAMPTVATATVPSKPLELELVMEKDVPGDDTAVSVTVLRKFAMRTNG